MAFHLLCAERSIGISLQGYTPPEAKESEYQTIPMSKIEDFGVHANQYYALEVCPAKILAVSQVEHVSCQCCSACRKHVLSAAL